jgi:hypothetical protein
MQPPHQNYPINSGSACRAKAAALRDEARTTTSNVAIEKLLEIANDWDALAAYYDQAEQKFVA